MSNNTFKNDDIFNVTWNGIVYETLGVDKVTKDYVYFYSCDNEFEPVFKLKIERTKTGAESVKWNTVNHTFTIRASNKANFRY